MATKTKAKTKKSTPKTTATAARKPAAKTTRKPVAAKSARKSTRVSAKTPSSQPATHNSRDRYIPQKIEPKWQKKWAADRLYRAEVDPSRPKFYALTMLPYPSGELHIGHWYAMTPSDARARFMRMQGFNVMFPMGFDAFGLPAENAAIQRGIHPKKWTYANIERMRQQLRSMGAMFDWEREAVSADPEYYRWTQWFFAQLFKHGLAYKKMSPVDWCPKDNTTLAREQVWGEDRRCERCGTPVIKKNLAQWFFKITDYAEELLDFDGTDWPERVRLLQTNWVGRSEGAEVTFHSEHEDPITVFTTRPDTLWGATFMVLAPEHPLVLKLTSPDRKAEVETYVAEATRQSDIQREAADREKSGVFIGAYAINPVNGARIPIWTADYVLMTYGTGAIMGVPAHDERDFAFARKFSLPIPVVIAPPGWDGHPLKEAYHGEGVMVNSGAFDGTPTSEAVAKVTKWLEERGLGKGKVTYRLRDWLISRQRYWGAPIPIVYCPTHGAVPVPDDQLPVLLPDDVEWKPTGESPLKLHPTWSKTTCPICGEPATRETDTMDTFMCSSWYQYRYLSPDYDKGPWDPKEYSYWMPVDCYTGGIEHATMHLIYTRFFTKALRDMRIVRDDEPMMQLRNQGIILGEDSDKMSKSKGNVVAPDDLVKHYGADAVRAYLMFFSQWDQGGPWNSKGIEGVVRWLNRVWKLIVEKPPKRANVETSERSNVADLRRKVHQTVRRVTRDFENFEFNTIVAALMELLNALAKMKETSVVNTPAWDEAVDAYVRMMAPITPHVAEELWAKMGKPYSIHQQPWPKHDEAAAAEDMITLVLQVNGKVRDRLQVPADIAEAEAKDKALASETVRRYLSGKTPKQVVYVAGRLVNVVV
ncbi:MAG: leucine--tRNA ligase [Chloroflexi bacterium]|nr:leucine--tRNA ligase [Chloroflexota bacterium]